MKKRPIDRRSTDSKRHELARAVGVVSAQQTVLRNGVFGMLKQYGIRPADLARNPAMLGSMPFLSGVKAFAVWQGFKCELEGPRADGQQTNRADLKQGVREMQLRRLNQILAD